MRSIFSMLTVTLLLMLGQSAAVAELKTDDATAKPKAAKSLIDVPEIKVKALDAPLADKAELPMEVPAVVSSKAEEAQTTATVAKAKQAVTVPAVAKSELDAPTKAAVAKLERYLENTASMTAEFESVLLDPQGQPSGERSTGKLMIKRPGRFRWEYESPYPSLMLADGVNLWTYDEDLDEAIVRRLADYEAASPMLLLSGEVSVNDSFTVLGSHVVEGAQWLVLAPLEKDADFVTVRLKLKEEKIELMELVDKLDATSRIVFSDVKVNPNVNDSLFSFVLPEGVNLVGQPAPVPTAGPGVLPATTE